MALTRTRGTLVLAAAFAVLATTPALADVVVGEDNQTGTRDCGGGIATVNGNYNKLGFRNCTKLAVNGNDNVLDAGTVEAISLLGNGNRVSWIPGPDGRTAKVSDLGRKNQVAQGAPATSMSKRGGGEIRVVEGGDATVRIDKGGVTVDNRSGKGGVTVSGPDGKVVIDAGGGVSVGGSGRSGEGRDLVLDDSDATKTHDCAGGNAVINGGDNVLTLRNCRTVTINSGGNQVTVSGALSIVIPGSGNNVTWRSGADGRRPRIVDSGTDNTVSGR